MELIGIKVRANVGLHLGGARQRYFVDLQQIVKRHGVRAACYGHADVGCLHIRPIINVKTTEGVALGQVSHLFSTGANDVVVVRGDRERMIPFVQPDFVKSVDFEANLVVVDWDPEF